MQKIAWKKKLRSYYYKIVKDHGTPEYIARGWAVGIAVGSIIPISFQLLIAIPLSFLFKGSKIGAALGTCHTNPLTIWFIYPLQCYVGNKLIGGDLSMKTIESALSELIHEQSLKALAKLSGDIVISFLLGGVILALVLTPPVYYLVKHLVIKYRKRKRNKKVLPIQQEKL